MNTRTSALIVGSFIPVMMGSLALLIAGAHYLDAVLFIFGALGLLAAIVGGFLLFFERGA